MYNITKQNAVAVMPYFHDWNNGLGDDINHLSFLQCVILSENTSKISAE